MRTVNTVAATLVFATVLTCALAASATADAETFDSTIADTRTTVGLRVDPAAAQAWLPADWNVASVPKGPFEGANLFVVFIDRLLHLDADGNPKGGGAYRMAALAIPAKSATSDERTLFISRVYTPHEGAGPYKTSMKTTVRREIELTGVDVGPNGGSDSWTVRDANGGSLLFRMNFEPAVPKRVQSEMRPRSTVDPTFFRIYRYEQVIDVVKSEPATVDRVRDYELTASITELKPMFNGTEQLVGIAVIPWYKRETYMP